MGASPSGGAGVRGERSASAGPAPARWRLALVGYGLAVLVSAGMTRGAVNAQGASAEPGLVRPASMDEVVDFATIQAGDVVVGLDPSGTSATISASTTIDAACAVAFGDDETLGRLALDTEMGAAAHRDHRVVLGGLQPGTSYVFRLQGSGIDGRLYRSQPYPFTTPAAAAAAPDDLARSARIVEVSSEYSNAFAAGNAIDGDPATEWSSRGDGDDAFITLDLGQPADITSVAFRTRQMSDGTGITRTFTVAVDGTTYGPFPASAVVPLKVRAQVLRLDVETSTGGNTGATALEVHGTVDVSTVAEGGAP